MENSVSGVKRSKFLPVIIVAAVMVVVVTVIIILVLNSDGYKLNHHLKTAQKYVDNYDYKSAAAEYQAAIEIDTFNKDAVLGLAQAYVELDKTDKAIAVLENAFENNWNSDVAHVLYNIRDQRDAVSLEEAQTGDLVYFGDDTYNNRWIVLDRDGDKLLLMNKYSVTNMNYNVEYDTVTWEDSMIREWLNSEYLEDAFSKSDRELIQSTYVVNDDNPEYGTDGGADTLDYIYLLSIDEVNRYFSSDEERNCVDTYGFNKWWWLRSPGDSNEAVADVRNGSVFLEGVFFINESEVVRPILWIDVSGLK